MNAIAAVVIGWAVDRYELRRTWVIGAGCLLLGGMMVLEVRNSLGLVPGVQACVSCARPLWRCLVTAWAAPVLCLHGAPGGVRLLGPVHGGHACVCCAHTMRNNCTDRSCFDSEALHVREL